MTMNWIFFDLDDTLWDFRANSLAALRMLYGERPLLAGRFPTFDAFADRYHEVNDRFWSLYHAGEIDAATLKTERFREVMDRLISPGESLRLNSRYLDLLCSGQELVPGAVELLRNVSRYALIGILSNGFLNTQYRKLRPQGIWRYVQRCVISEEIGIQKPDPAVFEYALAETGASRSTAIMVGDNPLTDVAGAMAAGWRAIYFDRSGSGTPPPGGCTAMASSLEEVGGILKGLFLK